MESATPNIPEAEWAVLQLLWEHGPSTVRQLLDVLYPGGGPSEYATVHKLLERLQAKGLVRRERGDGGYVFEAALPRDEVVGQQFEALVEKLCNGSLQTLLTNLVKVKRLSADELRELLALVEETETPTDRRKRRK
jgi:predicted transcriptional regulator